MDIIELNQLRKSSEAPFIHDEYTIWIHNKIVDKINYDLWTFRERESAGIKSSYVACNKIMSIPSLKRIE
jgi:hypothetical protein